LVVFWNSSTRETGLGKEMPSTPVNTMSSTFQSPSCRSNRSRTDESTPAGRLAALRRFHPSEHTHPFQRIGRAHGRSLVSIGCTPPRTPLVSFPPSKATF
jgi:hypothetical protein